MRVTLASFTKKQFSRRHRTALEAACAYDLARLAVLGPGAAAESALDRLQTLVKLTGLTGAELLQRGLSRDGYLRGVLTLSPQRMTAAASGLQQVLTDVCCTSGSTAQQQLWLAQLRAALASGSVGRLLLAGDMRYQTLVSLAAAHAAADGSAAGRSRPAGAHQEGSGDGQPGQQPAAPSFQAQSSRRMFSLNSVLRGKPQ
eukprot:gene8616-8797_t